MAIEQLPPKRYQDYVIRDGKLIGDFDGLYRDFEDPWHQSDTANVLDSRRQLAVHWVEKLRTEMGASRVVELGCGFGHLSGQLSQRGIAAVGIDISTEAIERARTINPGTTFMAGSIEDEWILTDLDPDVVIMAELTWYILDKLDLFLDNLRTWAKNRSRPAYLIHLLAVYPPGVQKYGADRFTNDEEIRKYFGLSYLEWGTVATPKPDDPLSKGTYFVAKL
ncbi:class I SAM-dependent methyltransferase [Devosia sp.]|uniref:class I SAM-dependent methyltransferase n=1 Tax=Devosia sp. TaxID=1871048 RepID=UPI003267209A